MKPQRSHFRSVIIALLVVGQVGLGLATCQAMLVPARSQASAPEANDRAGCCCELQNDCCCGATCGESRESTSPDDSRLPARPEARSGVSAVPAGSAHVAPPLAAWRMFGRGFSLDGSALLATSLCSLSVRLNI